MLRPPPISTLFPYTTLFRSLVDVLDVHAARLHVLRDPLDRVKDLLADRKSTRLNSSHRTISYAVFCLKKKKNLISLLGPRSGRVFLRTRRFLLLDLRLNQFV